MKESILNKLIWNINDLGNALGRTERSIRVDMHRQNWLRIPPPTRLGGTLAWRPQDVCEWLEKRAKESGAVADNKIEQPSAQVTRRGPGRPRKKI